MRREIRVGIPRVQRVMLSRRPHTVKVVVNRASLVARVVGAAGASKLGKVGGTIEATIAQATILNLRAGLLLGGSKLL